MLAVLKGVGWFLLTFVLTDLFLVLSYYFFMSKWAYRWSVYSVRKYLSNHGRGNFEDENQYIVGIDIVTRIIWVCVFALIGTILGVILVPPDRWLIVAVVLAAGLFALGSIKLELCFVIKIGRLKSVDEEAKCAYFVNLKNEVFTYDYGDPADRENLIEERKYLVADYLAFAMVGPVDEYEWG